MNWRDQMAPATFRGVQFHVDVAERAGGRRTVLHEYPLRDKPYVEDTGRRARLFPVEGYVIGDDYLAQRDALIAALEDQSGPGELLHPYYGTRRVICVNFRVRESTEDGGMARFAIDFGETDSSPAFPTAAAPAGAARVDVAGDAIVAAIRARLAARYTVSLPRAALASASAMISSAAKSVQTELAPLVATTQELAAFKRDLDALILDADSLARQPFGVLDGLTGALAALTTPVMPPFIAALLAAYGFDPGARPPATTSTRQAEQKNYDLLLAAIRTALLVQAARLAPDAGYDSYDAAVAARSAIAEKLDEQSEVADDATFAALEQLRADLVRAVPGEDTDLPRLTPYVPAYTVPSLVLAHRLYGDLSREADLVARNRVADPGFIVGGVELEVLSSA